LSTELLIDSAQNGSRIALLQDKQLLELHSEGMDNQFKVGDIYLGTVRKIVNGLNAAFIDVGYEKDAFLHYQDLGPNVNSMLKFTKMVRNNNYSNYLLKGFENEPEIDKIGKSYPRPTKCWFRSSKNPFQPKVPDFPVSSLCPGDIWCSYHSPIQLMCPRRYAATKSASGFSDSSIQSNLPISE
jgi:Ribonuclease G/E